jgi:hypothetical protein
MPRPRMYRRRKTPTFSRGKPPPRGGAGAVIARLRAYPFLNFFWDLKFGLRG